MYTSIHVKTYCTYLQIVIKHYIATYISDLKTMVWSQGTWYVLRALISLTYPACSLTGFEWESYFTNLLSSAANSIDFQVVCTVDETLDNLGHDYTLEDISDG
jgi:hypothetical protein